MTDQQIVALYWERNEDAVSRTAQKYGAYLGKIACNVLMDSRESEECVNDTYLRAWNSIPDQRPQRLDRYLGKIARGLAIDCYRKKHAGKRLGSQYALSLEELGDTFPDGATPEAALQARELQRALDAFVRELPPAARTVFVGRYYYFDSVGTIAGYCRMSTGTVKSTLYRTRQALKAYLIKEGFEV